MEAIWQALQGSSLEWYGNQFQYVWSFHETQDLKQYVKLTCYHNTEQQVDGKQLWILLTERLAIATSEELLEIVACFLDFHEIKEEPRQTLNPIIDLLVSM